MREFEQGKFPTEVTLETRTFKTKGLVREWQKTHSHSMNIARITGNSFVHGECIYRAARTVMRTNENEQRKICHYILAYLADNPDAGDTLDGIVEWWLLRQRVRFETRNVSEAVARLVSEELIEEHGEADSNIIYRVNRTKDHVIRNLLNSTNGSIH